MLEVCKMLFCWNWCKFGSIRKDSKESVLYVVEQHSRWNYLMFRQKTGVNHCNFIVYCIISLVGVDTSWFNMFWLCLVVLCWFRWICVRFLISGVVKIVQKKPKSSAESLCFELVTIKKTTGQEHRLLQFTKLLIQNTTIGQVYALSRLYEWLEVGNKKTKVPAIAWFTFN